MKRLRKTFTDLLTYLQQAHSSHLISHTTYWCLLTPRAGVPSVAMSMFVCLSVCLLAYLENHTAEFHLLLYVACGRGSVLLWQDCDTLCTSDFVDDVIFTYAALRHVMCISRTRQTLLPIIQLNVAQQ